jgi:hypothetical protein
MIDEIRQRFPHVSFALYVTEPGVVTLEVYAEDEVFTFTGPTAAAVLERAFPPPARTFFELDPRLDLLADPLEPEPPPPSIFD